MPLQALFTLGDSKFDAVCGLKQHTDSETPRDFIFRTRTVLKTVVVY